MNSNDRGIGSADEWRAKEKQQQGVIAKQPLSTGISPSSFYSESKTKVKIHLSSRPKSRNQLASNVGTTGNAQNDDYLSSLFTSASLRVRQNQFKEIMDREKLRRVAFRDALSSANRNIKLFGLQSHAFLDFDARLAEHLQHHAVEESDSKRSRHFSVDLALELISASSKSVIKDASGLEQEKSEKEILEDATSISSIDEPKRHRAHYSAAETQLNTQTQQSCGLVSPGNSLQRNIFRAEFERTKNIPILEMGFQDSLLPMLWSMEPRIFSKEVSSNGKRKYVVASYGRFSDYYWRKCVPTGRHYYELIRENTPCRLYFDLEFCCINNPELASSKTLSDQLMSELIEEVCFDLKTTFGDFFEERNLDRRNFVDLDSSTSKKFSRHIIVHLPNQLLFASTSQVGNFVKKLVGRLAEEIGTGLLQSRRPVLAKYLFVNAPSSRKQIICNSDCKFKAEKEQGESYLDIDGKDSNTAPDYSLTQQQDAKELSEQRMQSTQASESGFTEKWTCFIDLGVYTKNRLFRLLGSSKYGKPPSAALHIAEANTFAFTDFSNENFHGLERKKSDSASNIPNAFFAVSVENTEEAHTQRFRSAADWSAHAEALEKTLVVPLNWTRVKWPLLPNMAWNERERTATIPSTQANTRETRYATSVGPSPFPCLDQYVKNVLGTRGGVEGDIRSWSIRFVKDSTASTQSDTAEADHPLANIASITYQIIRNRWCERIGRHHKSNGIMWTVDLRNMYCLQTCHDAECRRSGFQGKILGLPTEIRLIIEETLFDAALVALDEEAIIVEAERKKLEEEEFERALLNLLDEEAIIVEAERKKLEEEEFERALLNLDISGL